MALSVMKVLNGVQWPLGFIPVATAGTPVNIMSRVDANNLYAPGTAPGPLGAAYSARCHKIFFQGYSPGNNNNGMLPNSGNIYVLIALGPGNSNSGGPGNRTDSGAMVLVVPPGGFAQMPADEIDRAPISPYGYAIDADVSGEGALVTLTGVST